MFGDGSSHLVSIDFVSSKHCFVLLPKNFNVNSNEYNVSFNNNNRIYNIKCFLFQNLLIFKIESIKNPNKSCYLSWNGEFSNKPDTLQINKSFGQKLKFKNGEQVMLESIRSNQDLICQCKQCFIRPIVENDWEILYLNSNFIENNLLNQIRIININQIFPIWIQDGNLCLFVEAFKIKPENNKKLFVLEQFTEVIVAPTLNEDRKNDFIKEDKDTLIKNDQSEKQTEFDPPKSSMISSMFNAMKSLLPTNKDAQESNKSNDSIKFKDEILDYTFNIEINKNFRVLPLEHFENIEAKIYVNCVFISDIYFDSFDKEFFIAKLINILSPNEKSKISHQTNEETSNEKSNFLLNENDFKETFVFVLKSKNCPLNSILICDKTRRQMGLSISSKVFMTSISHIKIPLISSFVLHPIGISHKTSKISSEQIINQLDSLIRNLSTKILLLCKGTLMTLLNGDFLVEANETHFCISKESLLNIKIEIGQNIINPIKTCWGLNLPLHNIKEIDAKYNFYSSHLNNSLGGVQKITTRFSLFLKNILNLDQLSMHINTSGPFKSNSLLLYGSKGSGKSSIIDDVISKFNKHPYYVFIQKIDCKSLKGKRIESIEKSWLKLLKEAYHRQPSLLIFEDLDAICSNLIKPEQEHSSDLLYYERIALILFSLINNIDNISNGSQVGFISTANSIKSLHPLLVQSRGRHFFNELIEISLPNLERRKDILSAIIFNKLNIKFSEFKQLNLKDIALRSEGFLPIDLSLLIDKAIHSSALRMNDNSFDINHFTLTNGDFDEAFDGFSSISLRNINFHSKSLKNWQSIGGLMDLKRSLIETLLWPCKYPNLFSKLPLKQQSGILLFGPPGTGKTLLAEAASNQCGMNFISVKGPELLSKYIGASELAVRDLFSRAQCAKPCIIFFDEFDSIAPKRGHDSTGVTDRVVNQLLTQMDGVEALQNGIYILAASSRPDLLDPALLRPGRFDKCLYCPLPDQLERLEILKVLSVKLNLNDDTDLKFIASMTEHFSGADLQGLLYSAQLEALFERINNKQQISKDQQNKQSSSQDQLIAYMPTVEQGFAFDCVQMMDDIQVIKSNIINSIDETSMSNEVNVNCSEQELVSIHQRHLLTALNNTKPSVNETERKRYENM